MTTDSPPPTETLSAERDRVFAYMTAGKLPGWDDRYAQDPKIRAYITGLHAALSNAIRDDAVFDFKKTIGSIIKSWERVNELLAEAYRATHPDPETWELRYVKWMPLTYIHFDSPHGEFCLVPRRPRGTMPAPRWYTVDEMLEMLEPGVAQVITIFGAWPNNHLVLKPPGPGEQVVHAYGPGTGSDRAVVCELPKRRRYG